MPGYEERGVLLPLSTPLSTLLLVRLLARRYYPLGVRARIAARCAQLGGYRRNRFEPLPAGLRARVAARWAEYTAAWGYQWGS